MDNLFRNYALSVFPITDWRRFVSPTIVFGNANIADSDTEQKVVDSVGSYGYQLNRILDALAVLIREHEDLDAPKMEMRISRHGGRRRTGARGTGCSTSPMLLTEQQRKPRRHSRSFASWYPYCTNYITG